MFFHLDNCQIPTGFCVIENHPVVESAFSFRQKMILEKKLKKSFINFIKQRAYFIYPKTLYLDFSNQPKANEAMSPIDIEGIQLDEFFEEFNKICEYISEILKKNHPFSRLIINLKNSRRISQPFLNTIDRISQENQGQVFLLGDDLVIQAVSQLAKNIVVYNSPNISQIIDINIREYIEYKFIFPPLINYTSLEIIAKKQLIKSILSKHEVVRLDMTNVSEIDYFSICLINAIIHSLAHQYGMLCRIVLPKALDAKNFIIHSRILNVNKNLIVNYRSIINDFCKTIKIKEKGNIIEQLEKDPFQKGSIDHTGLLTFNKDRMHRVLIEAEDYFVKLMNIFDNYFKYSIDKRSNVSIDDRRYRLLNFYDMLFYEIIDNAANHSAGLSYFGLFLDKRKPLKLYCYIGDAGCGLLKKISESYDLKDGKIPITHEGMIQYCFRLKEMKCKKNFKDYGGGGLDRVRKAMKFIKATSYVRTGNYYGFFDNFDNVKPSITKKGIDLLGTHYFITIPLERVEKNEIKVLA